jgi:hypothetical protein
VLVRIAQGTSAWWELTFCEEKEKKIEMSPPPRPPHLHQSFTKTHGFPWDVSLGTSFLSGEISLETEVKFSKFEK